MTAPLASQGISVGAAASYGEDSDFGVGPRVSLAIPAGDLGLSLVGSFDYFFPSDAEADAIGADINYWELNGNVVIDISVGGTVAPYAGAGINYVEASGSVSAGGISISTSESEVGANLLGWPAIRVCRTVAVPGGAVFNGVGTDRCRGRFAVLKGPRSESDPGLAFAIHDGSPALKRRAQ